jgi:hypothetical protein
VLVLVLYRATTWMESKDDKAAVLQLFQECIFGVRSGRRKFYDTFLYEEILLCLFGTAAIVLIRCLLADLNGTNQTSEMAEAVSSTMSIIQTYTSQIRHTATVLSENLQSQTAASSSSSPYTFTTSYIRSTSSSLPTVVNTVNDSSSDNSYTTTYSTSKSNFHNISIIVVLVCTLCPLALFIFGFYIWSRTKKRREKALAKGEDDEAGSVANGGSDGEQDMYMASGGLTVPAAVYGMSGNHADGQAQSANGGGGQTGSEGAATELRTGNASILENRWNNYGIAPVSLVETRSTKRGS